MGFLTAGLALTAPAAGRPTCEFGTGLGGAAPVLETGTLLIGGGADVFDVVGICGGRVVLESEGEPESFVRDTMLPPTSKTY